MRATYGALRIQKAHLPGTRRGALSEVAWRQGSTVTHGRWCHAGLGWHWRPRGRRTQVFCHTNSIHALAFMEKHFRHISRLDHHHHHQAQTGLCVIVFFCRMSSAGSPRSCSLRERRLRSTLRHEQQTVHVALAAALHHSAGPKEKMVELQQYAALRGQKNGARTREGEVHEKNDAPRRQKAPHLGERPGILAEPGPQRSDRSRRHSSGEGLPLPTAAPRRHWRAV